MDGGINGLLPNLFQGGSDPSRTNPAVRVLRRVGLMTVAWITVALVVYASTGGRASPNDPLSRERLAAGEAVWRAHDCQACHSLYGLGGHLGMDLTNVMRDRDATFVRLTLRDGRGRMPAFSLREDETAALLVYFEALNASAESPLRGHDAPWFGRF